MPLYDPNADAVPQAKVPVADITEPKATVATYDSRDMPGPKLIVDIEGEPWTTEYYRQILSVNDSPRPLDLGIDPTLQQYEHYAQFRISVTDDLTSTTDSVTGTVTISGEGLLYPDTLIPNVGDMFIGRIELATQAVFTVTTVERLSFYARAVYRIGYRMYSGYDTTIIDNLKLKVINDFFFDNKRLIAGNNPIVDYDTINREERYLTVIDDYMTRMYQDYYSEDIRTFCYWDESNNIYDPFAVAFFNTVLGLFCRKDRPMPTEYSYGERTKPMERPTLWRMIHKANRTGINYLYPRDFKRTYASAIDDPSTYLSISYLNVTYVRLPDKWDTSNLDTTIPAYVLSHAFYEQDTANMSELETAVTAMIDGESIGNAVLDRLIDALPTSPGEEQFYQMLLISAMLKIKLQEI